MPEPVRIKDIPETELTPEQANVFKALVAGRGRLLTPYRIWIHSPRLAAAPRGIVVDRTCFYATSGGQPGDSGILVTPAGEFPLATAVYNDQLKTEIAHVPADRRDGPGALARDFQGDSRSKGLLFGNTVCFSEGLDRDAVAFRQDEDVPAGVLGSHVEVKLHVGRLIFREEREAVNRVRVELRHQ